MADAIAASLHYLSIFVLFARATSNTPSTHCDRTTASVTGNTGGESTMT